jgi:hypothetical protein
MPDSFQDLITSIKADLYDAKNAEARMNKLHHRAGLKLLELYE